MSFRPVDKGITTYRAYYVKVIIPFDSLDQAAVITDLTAFCGKNAAPYIAYYEKARTAYQRTGRLKLIQSWSWPTFLLGYVWFFYRKLWVMGALVFILPIAIMYAVPSVGTAPGIVAVIAGVMAKYSYVTTALSRISKANKAGLTGTDRLAFLRQNGGVSKLAGILALTFWVGFIAYQMYLGFTAGMDVARP